MKKYYWICEHCKNKNNIERNPHEIKKLKSMIYKCPKCGKLTLIDELREL